MHHPTDRIAHTTAFVTPVVEHWLERDIAQWVHHMKDRSDDPSHHERTPLPRSYILLLFYQNQTLTIAYLFVFTRPISVDTMSIVDDRNSNINFRVSETVCEFVEQPKLPGRVVSWCTLGWSSLNVF